MTETITPNEIIIPGEIKIPVKDDRILSGLKAGDMVYITGIIYTARDAAHKRLAEMAGKGEKYPFDFTGAAVFYAGPSPEKPGKPIGSVGPTTAGRMDLYAPLLISKGLKIMIGKGLRSPDVTEAIKKYNGIYFAATGGIAALMARCVKSSRVIAFEDLGTEAIRELKVEKLPVYVAIDCRGNNLYETGRHEYEIL
ncbi:MAG: Fe-S-containing hydro-lyase [Treponema sp.]|nr:Fe-S-containing hydro-lyase [Treponema sp.]